MASTLLSSNYQCLLSLRVLHAAMVAVMMVMVIGRVVMVIFDEDDGAPSEFVLFPELVKFPTPIP